MKAVTSLGGVVLLALLAGACGQTDPGITTAVKSKFAADDTVKAYQIDVDTADHVVTLSGSVESSAVKERAVTLARQTEGVRSVEDKITVTGGSAALPGDFNTSATGQAAEEKAREGANAVVEFGRDAVAVTTDAALTAAVKTKLLADKTVGGLKIDVDTKDHVVTLSGTVRSAAEKTEAVRIARSTDGVKTVRDNLKVAR